MRLIARISGFRERMPEDSVFRRRVMTTGASGRSSQFDDEGSLASVARAAADWLPSGALAGRAAARVAAWVGAQVQTGCAPPAPRTGGCVIGSHNSEFASFCGSWRAARTPWPRGGGGQGLEL